MPTNIAALPARSSLQNNQRITSWYPTADMLQLPYVPEKAKEQVRKVLAPVLAKMKAGEFPVEENRCWDTSAIVVILAESPRVKHVEGVWLSDCDVHCNFERAAVQHAWNIVDGYVVDLSEELYMFREDRRQPAPEREPHTIFTVEEVVQHLKDHAHNLLRNQGVYRGGIISLDKWLLNGGFATLPAHLKTGHWDDKGFGEAKDLHFNETTMRLRNRLEEKVSV